MHEEGSDMDTPQLPQSDKDAEIKIIAGLRTQGMEVTKWDWRYVPQIEEWQLFVKTSWIESHGREVARRALDDALVNAGIDESIASRVRLEMP
jgi:hypothetical protein